MTAKYQIYAIRYGRHERTARHNFLGGDEHDGPMPLDFYVWAIVGDDRTIILDTGCSETVMRRRGRQITRPVAEGLKAIGIAPEKIEDVVISHMHYDHAGNHELFPRARYHIQDAEMAHCAGRCMGDSHVRAIYEAEDVTAMIHRIFTGRVVFHEGEEELAPGITLHKVGGHTQGLQIVRVQTERGWVVLGSDAAHFYANMEEGRPFPIVDSIPAYFDAHRTMLRLASSPEHIIPGHDPLVLARYPAAKRGLEGVARLDLRPAP